LGWARRAGDEKWGLNDPRGADRTPVDAGRNTTDKL